MKKHIFFLASFITCVLLTFDAVSQCTPGTNFVNPRLLYPLVGTYPPGTQPTPVPPGTVLQADTDYLLEVTLNPTMNSDQVLTVIGSADGFGYIPCQGCAFQYIPPSIGKDTGPSSIPIKVVFSIHTYPDPADIGQYLYFSIHTECGSTLPRPKGSVKQFTIATNR